MNRFTVDFSSSVGSENLPSNSPQQQRRNIFSVPDDVASTTPAAPPPSQLFGSSRLGTGVSKLQFATGSDAFPSSAPRFQSTQQTELGRPKSRLFETSTNTYATQEDDDAYTDDAMDDESEEDRDLRSGFQTINKGTAPSLMKFSTNSLRQSANRSVYRGQTLSSRSQLPRKGNDDMIPRLARDISRRQDVPAPSETDEVVLETEEVMRSMDEQCQECADEGSLQAVVTIAAQELLSCWKKRSRHRAPSIGQNIVGPDARSSPFEKARYLATLLLQLHHPQFDTVNTGTIDLADSRHENPPKSTPQVLLEWLDQYHVNYAPLYEQVMTTAPAPSANELYWDAIESFAMRGKFHEVMELLKRGDLNHAVVDTPEGPREANFTGTQLQQAEEALYRARQLVNICPAVQDEDWNTGSQDWNVWRKQLELEIEQLRDMVESHNDKDSFQQSSNFGMFGHASGKSGLPFVIYQRLRTLYGILLGDANEIIGLAQDWVEASMMLTVWWVPTDEKNVARWSFDVSRASNPQINDTNPYLTRLRDSFLCVTDSSSDNSFQINTMNAVEVGLGAVMQEDVQSCLRILQTLSLCVTSAVAEIGSWAAWLSSSSTSEGLTQDDLMVLNYGSNDLSLKKDDVLEKYATSLFDRHVLHTTLGGEVEGWELSFSILSRLDDQERMHSSISDLLQKLPVTTQERTAKLVEICQQFGLEEEGRKVSENFADSLVNNTSDYGTALLCYARAHAEHKVRQLIDLLNSYCLVQSQVYPPVDEMDPALEQLVGNPKSALQGIAEVDPQAAETLQFHLVGYACLRRFYSLRDEQTTNQGNQLRPLAARRAAARSLIAAISSAADSIYGGLYDPDRQSAIQVDGLMTMLGEATALMTQEDGKRIFNSEQLYALLAAIEDLETVNDRVYNATEECMEAALRNYRGSAPPSPHAMLKKSVSSGTNSNFSFSMMGSEMLARSADSLGGTSIDSTFMVGKNPREAVARGWDWRSRFKDPSNTGAEVLKRLRTSIAQELSIAVLDEKGAGL